MSEPVSRASSQSVTQAEGTEGESKPRAVEDDVDEADIDALSMPLAPRPIDDPAESYGPIASTSTSRQDHAALPDSARSSKDGEDDLDLEDLEDEAFLRSNGHASQDDSEWEDTRHGGLKNPRKSRRRADSLTVGYDFSFSRHLLPISLTREGPAEGRGEEKTVGLVNGIALVIGSQIGSGIFSSPGVVTADTGSVGASLLVWLGSGILAWTGASCFAELGAAIPLNGGSQAYLNHSFGPETAYLFAWTAITALKPGSAAIIAIVFSEFMCRIFYHTAFSASSEESAKAIPLVVIKLVAIIAVALISLLNAISVHLGNRTQVVLTFLKLIALLAVAIMGLVQLARGQKSSSFDGNIFAGSSHSPGNYALALYSGLWAFDGFDQTNYVAGEMVNVKRDLPRTIHISLSTVLFLFLSANFSYFIVLSKEQVAQSNTVALDFGKALFGGFGGVFFALVVAVSCFGALNSSFFTSARLIYVAGKEGYLPKLFAKLHATRKTPINAIILQAALTTIMVIVGNFKSLVNFYGVCTWLWYLMTVMSLLALRTREPNLERPYRTWLSTPIIFSCVAVFLLFMPIFSAPLEALAAFGFILAGLPIYFLTQTRSDGKPFGESLRNFKLSSMSLPSSFRLRPLREAGGSSRGHRRQASQTPTLPRVSEAEEEEERVAMLTLKEEPEREVK